MSISVNSALIGSSCQPKPASIMGRFGSYLALARQRRQLAALDIHLLVDIGVTPAQARDESAKTAWDVPNHWHH